MTARTVEVRLLGPLQVLVDGREVDVGGARPRAVLAALAVGRPARLPVDELVAAVWGEDPPTSAEATLRVYVSRLRKVLGDAIDRDRTGYGLHARCDVDEFTAATAAAVGEPAAAGRAEQLGRALQLWRGPALADVPLSPVLRAASARLAGARLEALRQHAEALLAGGHAAAAVDVLAQRVEEAPDREQLAGVLMRALYRSGRQTEALDTYRRVRAALLERFGVEPGPDLRALHAAVLAQDPVLVAGVVTTPPARLPDGRPGTAPGGDEGAAPGAAPEQRAGNLPLPLTSFVGRATELVELDELLGSHRLVTLVGPGGTGKTRLALEAARRRRAPDGPWLVELAALIDRSLVGNVVAQSLGAAVQDGRRPVDVLTGALGDRSTLLLLDNCEHVLDAAAEVVEALLSRCPGVRILATSREPLRVPGEKVMPVQPLPVTRRTPELLAVEGDAMRLFAERARQVLPGFALDPPTAESVRRICRDLDGLPLAIELAAAELRALSPAQLAEQLSDRFEVLTSGPRTALPRQRTLLTTVSWSVDLLDEPQRELFAQLSVFSGGFELDAVRAVAGPSAAVLVADLVDKSLVEVDTTREPRRYRLLETLRAYGLTLLDDHRAAELLQAHARWCAQLVADAAPQLRGPEAPGLLRRLDDELANCRTALRTLLDSADRQRALAMAAGLWWYWFRRARVDEGRRWLAEVLAGEHPPSRELAAAQMGQAFLTFFAGDDPDEVERANEASIATAVAAGDDVLRGVMLCYAGYRRALQGRIPEGDELVAEGCRHLPGDAPGWALADAAFCRAQVDRAAGRPESAQQHLRDAHRRAREVGHHWMVGVSAWVAGELALELGRPAEAARLLGHAVDQATADGDRATVIAALRALAATAARLGAPTDGARLMGAVTSLSRRSGVDMERMQRQDVDRADVLLRRALRPDAYARAVEGGAALGLRDALVLAAAIRGLAGDTARQELGGPTSHRRRDAGASPM